MSKRRVERDIERLGSDVLGELSPDDRLRLFLEAVAEGNEVQLERLQDSAPLVKYRATDPAYTIRGRSAQRFLLQAIYELHTTSLEYADIKHQQFAAVRIAFIRDEPPSKEEGAAADFRAKTRQALFATLYSDYHVYRRFATETLGVDLETWFKGHPNGPMVLERVEADLEDNCMLELAEELLEEDLGLNEGEDSVLDGLVEIRYNSLVETWEAAISPSDM